MSQSRTTRRIRGSKSGSPAPKRSGRNQAAIKVGKWPLRVKTDALADARAGAATRPAPPIAGTTLDGKRLALADLRGKPVVINVWSSW